MSYKQLEKKRIVIEAMAMGAIATITTKSIKTKQLHIKKSDERRIQIIVMNIIWLIKLNI